MKKTNSNTAACACGSGKQFMQCCMPYISRERVAPTAEALMRSRYTAYVLFDKNYLLDSWHTSTRPAVLNLDADATWVRLKLVNCNADQIEFVATYKLHGKAHKLHETSRFVFEDGCWFYVGGIIKE